MPRPAEPKAPCQDCLTLTSLRDSALIDATTRHHPMPTYPSPVEVAKEWFEELWIKRNLGTIHRLMAADAKGYLEPDVTIYGPDGFVPVFQTLTTLFPELNVEIEDIVGDENHACVRWRAAGKHGGDALGAKATGKDITFRGITWMTVKDGMITEGWDSWNQGALLAQLGVQ